MTWVGSSGDWGDASKWSGGATPGQNDDAVINTSNGAITVTISSETVQVNSLSCEETLLLKGGTILRGTVTTDNGGVLVVQSGTLDGMTVNGVLDVGNTYNAAMLTVLDGLRREAQSPAERGHHFPCRRTFASLPRRAVRSNSAKASSSLANRSSQTMDVLAELTTSSDHSVSCSSRMIDTSTVTPSFFTVRESPDLTILGSRSTLPPPPYETFLFDGADAF